MKRQPDNEAVLFGLERTSYMYICIFRCISMYAYVNVYWYMYIREAKPKEERKNGTRKFVFLGRQTINGN
jgi:hypothetical protein